MADMLVKLYGLAPSSTVGDLGAAGIRIVRPLALDKAPVLEFVGTFGNPGWTAECEVTLVRQPATCFVAVHEQVVIGFACYDATAKGMLGPLGVAPTFRKRGVASALIRECLAAMKADGYAYAIIGWVSSESFYAKVCGAIPIPDSAPGVYARMIKR